MLWKMALMEIKRMKVIYTIITVLLVMVFLICIVITSAVLVKTKKYSAISKYLKQPGFLINAAYLQAGEGDEARLLKDEKELREYFPIVKDVLCGENLWETRIEELDTMASVWCYSGEAIDSLNPSMEEGKWFDEASQKGEALNAVVSYNGGKIRAGDTLTIVYDWDRDLKISINIIGVMENNESFFNASAEAGNTKDYRNCYYTYDYESEEGGIYLILSDSQILSGEEEGRFGCLNFRVSPDRGFQKQMQGTVVVTFEEDTPEEAIKEFTETLSQKSSITQMLDLENVNKNSREYITMELKQYFPVMLCIFIFVMIAVLSANVISTKKHLKDYSIYYMCGLSWKKCTHISLAVSALIIGASILLIIISFASMALAGVIRPGDLCLSPVHALPVMAAGLIFTAAAYYVPCKITGKNTAVTIMKEN